MTALHTFLTTPFLGTSTWLWLVFMAIVIGLLVLDLGVLHRQDREMGLVRAGRAVGAGVLHRVPGRAVAVDGQRVRHGNDLRLLRHPPPLPAPGIVLGHSGCGVPARDHDRRGCDTGAEL